MTKVVKSWRALKASGMYYVLVEDGQLWEAWAWTVSGDEPPTVLHQEGWRFQQTGESTEVPAALT